MASRAAILRAAQAAPGAAQPTPPPQGGSPWIGQLPSYSMEPGSGYSRGYGPFLPRPQQTFTQGAFGPFSPILPVPVDQPPPGDPRAQPRRFEYQVGWNLPVGVPGSEGYKLASFATLRVLADTYSILRTCLERRKNEIRALEWDVVLTPDAAKAYQGDREAMRDFGERRAKALKFFKRPDPNYLTFSSFLHAMMDQVFTFDALSLYMCPKRGKGLGRGLLGSDLDCLWLLDGSTIRPLLGLHGEVPEPPAPGYQQFIYGVPRADLTTMVAGLDLADSGLTERDMRTELRSDQLIYHPYLQRPDTPYGMSLVEQALVPIMTGLRKQAFQLDFFNESTVPRVYISPGDTTMTPNQIRELQDALNAVAGDVAWAFKIQVLPPGSKVMPQKEMAIVDDADNWIATEVAMVCDVSPVEIGLLPKVSAAASPFAAREMAQASRSIHERTATKPTLSYITEIFDTILQDVCRQDDMRFIFDGMEQTQDMAALTDAGIKQAQSGVKSIDEVRGDLHLPPWGLPETSSPVVFTQMGPVPLAQAAMDTISQQRDALTSAHSSAQGGSKPRKALPAGTSGQGRMNGPVTQRQARRGGALAPAHAMAEGSPGHSGASSPKAAEVPGYGGSQGPFEPEYAEPHVYARDVHSGAGNCVCGGAPDDDSVHVASPLAPSKAAVAELEALQRHLGKGMDPADWEPVHIPGAVMAVIADDLASGLSAKYAISQAMASLPKARHPRQSRQQKQMQQLVNQYRAQVGAALGQAIAQAQALIAQWIAGTLAVTAAVLASMIAALIQAALLAVLTALWTAAWDAAVRAAGGNPAKTRAALEAFLATQGANWASLISGTGMAALLAAITAALRAGNAAAVMHRLEEILNPAGRAEQIAVSEVTRAWNAATFAEMRAQGVAYKIWRNRGDAKVCPACRAKTAMGAVPLDQPYPDGTLHPPGHPRCRCWLEDAQAPKATKVLRREVGLNGQEVWSEWAESDEDPDYSGGRIFQPHLSDGTQIPGASVGMEPPRWDGSEPFPVVERAPDADDDAAYGSAAGIGSRPEVNWPAPYMDGYWPSGGHGMTQPERNSPGARTGRPPNAAGKRAGNSAARFLRGAPRAKASAVRRQMLENFPPEALGWVGRIRWAGPVDVPYELMDTAGKDRWAASHETGHVDQIAADLEAGKHVNPVIGVIRRGHNHIRLIDGRHRTLAHEKLGRPVTCYVGWIDGANEEAAYDTYHQQFHAGDSPQNKSARRDDMEAFQDRGEPVRQRMGIDGTAGDAQDIQHPFVPDRGFNPEQCVACGFPRTFAAHKSARPACGCCGGAGEHATGHECYRCDASGHPEGSERTAPFCEEVFRDPALHAKGCPHCGTGKSFTAGNLADGSAHGLVPFNLQGLHDESSLPGTPFGAPYCAGLVVRAADTGRLLMLQRAVTENDDGAGLLEWPGGHAEDGESLLRGAMREWSEEVGLPAPAGTITGHWESSNGVYAAFVLTIPREAGLDLNAPRQVENPDGDAFERAIWIDPAHLGGNQAVRSEVLTDLPLLLHALAGKAVKAAQSSAEVLREYWRGQAHPGPTMFALEEKIRWGEPGDWYRCVDEVSPYLGEGAKGYCNLRHKEVTGMSTAEHARLDADR